MPHVALKPLLLTGLLLVAGASVADRQVADGTVPIGTVAKLRGRVDGIATGGGVRRLAVADPLYRRDRIVTGTRSFVSIHLEDGSEFSLGAEAEITLDTFRFETPPDDAVSASILAGAFRFVTGLIAKRDPKAMWVNTGQVTTIGIRGTTVGGEVAGDAVTVVLLEDDGEAVPSAIEVGNPHGRVVIDQAGYGTHVADADSAPTPPQRLRLRAVDNLVRSLQSIQRIPVPRPRIR